jgi:hypothetical protein
MARRAGVFGFDVHFGWGFVLFDLYVLKHCAEAFILCDGSMRDPVFLVLNRMRQDNAMRPQPYS